MCDCWVISANAFYRSVKKNPTTNQISLNNKMPRSGNNFDVAHFVTGAFSVGLD